jgi:hypothetical protein
MAYAAAAAAATSGIPPAWTLPLGFPKPQPSPLEKSRTQILNPSTLTTKDENNNAPS